jgi:2-oxoglutarate dehydrogenase E2 component (dihydrolipoamide succinyltransferase)
MSVEVKVPNLPESVSDATVAKWHKKPGDFVSRDENLVDLETDKVVLEVPAPADGVLKDISAEEGATVTEGELLGLMEEGEAPRRGGGPPKTKLQARQPGTAREEAGKAPAAARRRTRICRRRPPSWWRPRTISMPEASSGSGRGGRVTKPDVIKHMARVAAPARARKSASRCRACARALPSA